MNDKITPTGDGDNNHKTPKNRQSVVIFLMFMLVSFLALNFVQNFRKDAGSKEITYDAFIDMLEEDKVEKVEDTGLTWKITPRTQPVGKYAQIKKNYSVNFHREPGRNY